MVREPKFTAEAQGTLMFLFFFGGGLAFKFFQVCGLKGLRVSSGGLGVQGFTSEDDGCIGPREFKGWAMDALGRTVA